MKTLHKFVISSIVFLLLLKPFTVDSQNAVLGCIIFEEGERYLETSYREDGSSASFGIVRMGYESQEKRDQAYETYLKGRPDHTKNPLFYLVYRGVKVGKVSSLKEFECSSLINFEEARKIEGLFAYRMIFIEKRNENEYILWRVTKFEQMH